MGFDGIVDIGGGEGYYAVGLARLMPTLKLIVFEAQAEGREVIQRMAVLNGIDTLSIRGFCTSQELNTALAGFRRPLVVCDIEGGEKNVLDPLACPGLRDAHILVELHDHLVEGCGPVVRERFGQTHDIREIQEKERTANDVAMRPFYLTIMPDYVLVDAMWEWRAVRQSWLWMQPRAAR